jgi:hypothetical protein
MIDAQIVCNTRRATEQADGAKFYRKVGRQASLFAEAVL